MNSAFAHLRTMIPTEPTDRKLSKIETLRLAKSYMAHLDAILATGRLVAPCQDAPMVAEGRSTSTGATGAHHRQRSSICTFCVASKMTANEDI